MDTNNNGFLIRRPSTALAIRSEPLEPPVTPVADIYETSDAFVIRLDMPGALKESISVVIEADTLSVQGKAEMTHLKSAVLLYGEIGTRSYARRFGLGDGLDRGAVEARFENGVLEVTIPKAESLKARLIQIK
jgi:HSP20 family protein